MNMTEQSRTQHSMTLIAAALTGIAAGWLYPDQAFADQPLLQNPGGTGVQQITSTRLNPEDAAKLSRAIRSRDWPAARALIARMAPDEALDLHKKTLEMMAQQLNATRGDESPMTPRDILEAADLLPESAAYPDSLLPMITQLLGRTLGNGDLPNDALEFLESTSRHFGQSNAVSRRRSLMLLAGAGQLKSAGTFFPEFSQMAQSNDIPFLAFYSAYLNLQAERMRNLRDNSAMRDYKKKLMLIQMRMLELPAPEASLGLAIETVARMSFELDNGHTFRRWLSAVLKDHKKTDGTASAALDGNARQVAGETAAKMLARIAATNLLAEPSRNQNVDVRFAALQARDALAHLLTQEKNISDPIYKKILSQIAIDWVREADISLAAKPNDLQGQSVQAMGMSRGVRPGQENPGSSQAQPSIPPEVLLAMRPEQSLLESVPADMQLLIFRNCFQLQMILGEADLAMESLENIARYNRTMATALIPEFLKAWAKYKDPNLRVAGLRGQGMIANAIPLTRLAQQKNVTDLANLLRRLEAISTERINPPLLADVFMTIYSRAEVYQQSDIHAVFGPPEKMDDSAASALISIMRNNLSSSWRNGKTQEAAMTNRSDTEMLAEVSRGYRDLLSMMDARQSNPPSWRQLLLKAQVLSEQAEFDLARKVDLKTYISERDLALETMHQAADRYVETVSSDPSAEENIEVYRQWFAQIFGAGDIQQLNRQSRSTADEIASLRASINSLPAESAQRHRTLFAAFLAGGARTLKPQIKPLYMRAGIEIVGDNPNAKLAAALVEHYDGLLNELELNVAVDGDSHIGAGEPFGLRIGLRHTMQLVREAGGFGKYIASTGGSGPQGGGYRKEFEGQIRKSISSQYDIVAISWADEQAESFDFGREGWRETPLAYVTLKAKEIGVDRIAPIQLDLDFMDRTGPVILPVFSGIQVVDARTASARPLKQVDVSFILNEQAILNGTLQVEINVKAGGLIPDFSEMFTLPDVPGVTLKNQLDRGMHIVRYGASSSTVTAAQPEILTERSWILTYALHEPRQTAISFEFPRAKGGLGSAQDLMIHYARYDNGNLSPVQTPVLIEQQGKTVSSTVWIVTTASASALILAGILGTIHLSRRKKTRTLITPESQSAAMSPFGVVHRLLEIKKTKCHVLPPAEMEQIDQAIRDIQQKYYSLQQNSASVHAACDDGAYLRLINRYSS